MHLIIDINSIFNNLVANILWLFIPYILIFMWSKTKPFFYKLKSYLTGNLNSYIYKFLLFFIIHIIEFGEFMQKPKISFISSIIVSVIIFSLLKAPEKYIISSWVAIMAWSNYKKIYSSS